MNAAPRAPDDFLVPLTARDGKAEPRAPGPFPRIVHDAASDERAPCRLDILIVENDEQLAVMLRDIIELERAYRVTHIARDLAETLGVIAVHRPGLALVDLHLGGNATGIEVAAKTKEAGIPTLFSTANPLPFPVPELALGCLCKPYTCYSVAQALRIAEQLIRGEPVNHDIPLELELY